MPSGSGPLLCLLLLVVGFSGNTLAARPLHDRRREFTQPGLILQPGAPDNVIDGSVPQSLGEKSFVCNERAI